MTSRVITIVVWVLLATGLVSCQTLAILHPDRLPGFGEILTWVMRAPFWRWLVFIGWMWLGWHLFVR